MDILAVIGVVHYRHFNRNTLLFCLQINHVVEEMRAVTVHVAHEFLESLLGMEHFLSCLPFLIGAQVGERDGDAGIEVCKLPHTLCYDVILVYRGGEYRGVRPELLACSPQVGLPNHFHGIEGLSQLILLLVYLAVAEHLREHLRGERVHAAHTHSVQSSADLV